MADQNDARFHAEPEFPNAFPAGESQPRIESGPRLLQPWRVVLHNDDVNPMEAVVEAIHHLTPLTRDQAQARMREAHLCGAAMLLVTHRERAELYVEQFQNYYLKVTIEPAT